MGCHAFYCNL
uniref:Uncharacterized protein n=1 Tax=Anguilla anguilla TaxID=7936 RepID=A0A0E9R6N7_ANGAN